MQKQKADKKGHWPPIKRIRISYNRRSELERNIQTNIHVLWNPQSGYTIIWNGLCCVDLPVSHVSTYDVLLLTRTSALCLKSNDYTKNWILRHFSRVKGVQLRQCSWLSPPQTAFIFFSLWLPMIFRISEEAALRKSSFVSPYSCATVLHFQILRTGDNFQNCRRSHNQRHWLSLVQAACSAFFFFFIPRFSKVVMIFRVAEEAASKVPGDLHPNSPAFAGRGKGAGIHRQPGSQSALHRCGGRAVQPAVHLSHCHWPSRVQVRFGIQCEWKSGNVVVTGV